uniref:FAD-binding PCMH-type domain-containing protein n=1 Tax=Bionectria ochroleuca TaxID=29856 RepID=A0A8H7NQJ9_BIOOC
MSMLPRVTALAALLLPLSVSSTQMEIRQRIPGAETTGFFPCDALIAAGLGDRLLLATHDGYEPRIKTYMSANAQYRPWCIVQPYTAQEVSLTVSTLGGCGEGAGDWHIAVRGGGNGNPGSNNVASGVTIDLGMMNHSSYDPSRQLASVEPGAAWMNVYSDLLESANVTVAGGRSGALVVLANGTIIEANSDANADLWKALKGGGMNFGIVTRFDMEAIPATEVAFGQSVFSANHSDQLFDAISEFTDHPQELAADTMYTLFSHSPASSEDMTAMVIRANTKGNLNTTSFDKITQIPSIESTWGLTSHAALAKDQQLPTGSLNLQKTMTFGNSVSIMRQSVTLHKQLISSLSERIGAENYTTAVFYQSIPKYFSEIGRQKEAIPWASAGIAIYNGNEAALAFARAELNSMMAKLKDITVAEGVSSDWVYMNYADTTQNPLGGTGDENVSFLKEVAQRYDPQGWWQRRVPGGFKVTRAT